MISIERGLHPDGGGACAMEWRYRLCTCPRCTSRKAKIPRQTDMPPCAPRSMGCVQVVNDSLDDDGRNDGRLAELIVRIPSLDPYADPRVVERVERRAALWAARSVEHLTDDPRVRDCNDTLERWLAGEVAEHDLAAAGDHMARLVGYVAWAAEYAADAGERCAAAAVAAARAIAYEAVADVDDLIDWLDRYLDAWHKIAADEGLAGFCDYLDYEAVNGS